MGAIPHALLPTESAEQQAVVKWRDIMAWRHPELALLHASQAGARVSWKQATKLKREGMAKGVPDLFLPVPQRGYHGLYIEMKRRKGGRLSQEQRWWHLKLSEQGYLVITAAGAERAIVWIERYLGIGGRGWTTPPEESGDVGQDRRRLCGAPEDREGRDDWGMVAASSALLLQSKPD